MDDDELRQKREIIQLEKEKVILLLSYNSDENTGINWSNKSSMSVMVSKELQFSKKIN